MSGNIPFSEFVDISTSTIKAGSTFGRLNALAIGGIPANSEDVNKKFQTFSTADEVLEVYGINSAEYEYSKTFFSYSSKTATKAQQLTFYKWIYKDIPNKILSAKIEPTDLDNMKINGTLRVSYNDEIKDVAVDLTQAKNFVDVASKVKEEINKAFASANINILYNDEFKKFIVETQNATDKLLFLVDEVETFEVFKGSLTAIENINIPNPKTIKEKGAFNITIGKLSASENNSATVKIKLNNSIDVFNKAVNNLQTTPLTDQKSTTRREDGASLKITSIKLEPANYKAENITLTYVQDVANDIVLKMKLAESLGAKAVAGVKAVELPEMMNEIVNFNGDYVSIGFTKNIHEFINFTSEDFYSKLKSIMDVINSYEQARYLFTCYVDDTFIEEVSEEDFTKINSLDNLILTRGTLATIPFLQAIIASVDYSAVNGALNINFIEASQFADVAITSTSELNKCNKLKINTPYAVGGYGNSQILYGEGHTCGALFQTLSVAMGHIWLKAQLQVQGMSLLNNSPFIALRGKSGQGKIIALFSSVLNSAVSGGVVVAGAELTQLEILSARDASGVVDIDKQLEQVGWFLAINELTDEDVKNKTLPITIVYVANIPTNRLIIRNFVIGA